MGFKMSEIAGSVDYLISQLIYQPINRSIDEWMNESINQSLNQSMNESINQFINQLYWEYSLFQKQYWWFIFKINIKVFNS